MGMSRVWGAGKGADRCDPTVLQACTRLLDALKAPTLTEEAGGRLRIEAWEGRLTSWCHLPSVLATLTAEVERPDSGSNEDAQGLCQRLGAALDGAGKEWVQWCERYPENCRTESRTQMGPVSRAEMCRRLGAEIQTMRHLRAELGSISVWQEHGRRYDVLGASAYLTHPEETLAFSFQGLMSAEPRLSAFIGTDRSPACQNR